MIVLGFVDEPVCYILDLRNDFDVNSQGATWHSYVVLPEPDTHRGNRECASAMHRAKQWPRECVSDAMLAPDMPAIFCTEECGEWIIIRPYTTVVLPTPEPSPDYRDSFARSDWHFIVACLMSKDWNK